MRSAETRLSAVGDVSVVWQDGWQIQHTLEARFNAILAERMHDMPVINPALKVQALAFERFNGDWIGILLTPWFMNLLLLPGNNADWAALAPGRKFDRAFPYGAFEFTVADESGLGRYALCSLFSPMFQFEDQAAAVAAGAAALQALLTVPERPMSRRDVLSGRFAAH